MSPRAHSANPQQSRTSSQPYPRRPSGQPKSSRQQFSACGACRMRRVRCDLKDIAIPTSSPHPACSNCKERGLKCVDEFADVKAVKLLRRGRRLQQVEAIYGKTGEHSASNSSYLGLPTRIPSSIPHLQPEFFDSSFWQWFSLQRPILDPAEFSSRFYAHAKGTHPLGYEGSLLAMLLVVWAASFGVDEYGSLQDGSIAYPSDDNDISSSNTRKGSMDLKYTDRDSSIGEAISARRVRKDRSESMLKEVLELVDLHSIMRRPTWDGVRVLLLILPLLEDIHPLDRLAMHEASLSQAHSLCTLLSGPSSIPSSSSASSDEAVVRARIFWYAYMQEGITAGMRGSRLVLSEEDLDVFQSTLPPFNAASPHASGVNYASGPGLPSPTSPTFSSSLPLNSLRASSPSSGTHPYLQITHLFSIPLHLSSVCRKVHANLTGVKAARKAEEGRGIDAEGMRDIWEGLDRCWEEFEAVRRSASSSAGVGDVDVQVERFVSGWQIFIFECRKFCAPDVGELELIKGFTDNVIRESLKQYIPHQSKPTPHSPTCSPPQFLSPHRLHDIASKKCLRLLPCILSIIKHNLTLSYDVADPTSLFKWDTGLVRDGCFFAAFLSASSDSEQLINHATHENPVSRLGRSHFKQEPSDFGPGNGVDIVRPGLLPILDADDGMQICLAAISEMRWAFSKSEEREDAIRIIWEEKLKKQRHGAHTHHFNVSLGGGPPSLPQLDLRYPPHLHPSSYALHDQRNTLSPLSLTSPTHATSNSAPGSACTTDGNGANGWPTYTPPGTSSSSTGTSISTRGSPVFAPNLTTASFKNTVEENFYQTVSVNDLDQFHFNAPPPTSDPSSIISSYSRTPSTHSIHAPSNVVGGSGYLNYNASGPTSGSPSMITHSDSDGCAPQFVEAVHGFYR
ncbi:hypothetical protein D9757_001781 [Collybiopsis confluens]|uniref:Zn(2)-C6 fungal-type domain-containing protein n=1 Tax=Collybiopsis confluens TaxID=2823264 RepID=A0A8H5MFG5_9AGAR|nr:hypothetical protein D9757_001781 [Collybiopsis confluens]